MKTFEEVKSDRTDDGDFLCFFFGVGGGEEAGLKRRVGWRFFWWRERERGGGGRGSHSPLGLRIVFRHGRAGKRCG